MIPSNDQSRCNWPVWLGLLLLVASGCARLAPGISPIASDPPETAIYGYEHTAELESEPIVNISQSDDVYVARQFPNTYSAPPPPSAYTVPGGNSVPQPGMLPQPSSVYQLPPPGQTPPSLSSAPQAPVYQSPQQLPVPLSGIPVAPPQSLPPPTNAAPVQGPGFQPNYQPAPAPAPFGDPLFGGSTPGGSIDPYAGVPSAPPVYIPNTRTADLDITGSPARTGRLMLGGAVNSDAGVTGQITIDERNFDITRWPKSFQDLASGTAWRGAGQTLRLEAVPGSEFKRYTASFADPNLFGYLPISFGLSGFLFDRRYQDFDEERLGGRISFGYRVTPDLSLTTALNGQNVEISNPRRNDVQPLNDVLGDNELYSGEFRLTHDTRDSPFQPSEGHFFEFGYERAFGDFDYSRFDIENRNYMLLAQRADGSGRQTVSFSTRLGFSGDETPLFENYFAGGYATMRGFDFRGASPTINGVQVGGRFQWLNTVEYMFPITADDAFRGVAFVDFGTVERDIEINKDNFRVAPGVGLRIAIPMLGPAPLAFDFAFPVSDAASDEHRIFSFYMSALR